MNRRRQHFAPGVCIPSRRRVCTAAAPRRLLPWLVCLVLLQGALPDVVINELMTSNGSTLSDENGDSPDWIELHNTGTETVDLAGWGLTDNPERPLKWRFREARLDPGAFLLIYASGKDRQPEAGSAIPPDTLPGLALWLRAGAIETNDLTQVRWAGHSVFVRSWRNGAHSAELAGDAIQDTAANQPLWVSPTVNGLPALRFDGVNDQLNLPRPTSTNSFCLFVVFRTSQSQENDPESGGGVGGTSGQRYLFGARHGGDQNAGMGLSVGTNGAAVYEHGSGYMPAIAAYAGPVGSAVTLAAVNYDARRITLEVGGLVARTGVVSSRAEIWAPTEIGSGAYGAFGGDLAEILMFNRSLSEAERRGVTRHLAERDAIRIAEPRHTNFQLDAQGEELCLTRPDGTFADRVHFGVIPRDVSYGRSPDGGAWWLFAEPTPGTANLTPGAVEFLEPPVFSHGGGFFTQTVELSLTSSTPGAQIRYTLDGSEPTPQSVLHVAPLVLRSRAGTANYLSLIPTVPGGAPPQGEVFKGWVVRARAFKDNALPSATVTRTFWITPQGRARYTLPVVSLAVRRADFFDPAIGIYVPGNAPDGNYSQRGPEWERPGHVELFETDGALAVAQEAGVKIHGNTSQGFPIKGLDLDATSGRGRQPFRHQFFPDRTRTEFEHVLLRPTGHDQMLAFMRDELMQSLAAETGAESQAARPCVVFINGEYWGLHYLKEKEDAEFVSFYGDHPVDELDYLEGYAAAKAGDTAHYDAMMAYVADHPLDDPLAYAEVQTRLEVPSYLDYKACEVFFYRWDIGNHRLWRPRSPEGRWRWLQFDNDVGWGGFWAEQPAWEFNMLEAVLTPTGSLHGHNNETTTFLFRRLMDSPEARRDFINRFADLMNTTLAASNTLARINAMAAALEPEMTEHIRRWRSPGSLAEWQQNVQYLRTFAVQRPNFARRHVIQQFGLRGTANLQLSLSPASAGRVRLNSLDLALVDGTPWTGVYFRGNPLRLAAMPEPGYRFAGWDGLPGVQTNTVSLLLNGDLALKARFEPEETPRPVLRLSRAVDAAGARLEVSGAPGSTWRLEVSDDLAAWNQLARLVLDDHGAATFEIGIAAAGSQRAYRLVSP